MEGKDADSPRPKLTARQHIVKKGGIEKGVKGLSHGAKSSILDILKTTKGGKRKKIEKGRGN